MVKTETESSVEEEKKAPGNIGYVRAIQKADAYFSAREFEQAKKCYTEALDFISGDKYAHNKIAECDTILKTQKK